MDEARTEYSSGKVNNKFQQFANDYGFKVLPCIAGCPNTKAKVLSYLINFKNRFLKGSRSVTYAIKKT